MVSELRLISWFFLSLICTFFLSRLADVGGKLEQAAKRRGDALDSLFAQLDKQLARSRNILQAHERAIAEKSGPGSCFALLCISYDPQKCNTLLYVV